MYMPPISVTSLKYCTTPAYILFCYNRFWLDLDLSFLASITVVHYPRRFARKFTTDTNNDIDCLQLKHLLAVTE